jgi:hypothetical protein
MATSQSGITAEDAYWDAEATKLRREALTNIRATAEKWTGAIGSLLGIFGIVVLVKGPDDIAKLSSDWMRYSSAALIGVAVIFAFLATLSSAFAAYGFPRQMIIEGTTLRSIHRQLAMKSAVLLYASLALVFMSLVSLGVAIGFSWLGDRQTESTGTKILALTSSREVFCGDAVQGPNGNLALQIKDADGNVSREIDLAGSNSVSVVDHCP